MNTTTTTAPATEKQVAFLTRLAAERPGWADVENLHADVIARLDRRAASAFIDQALALPREASAAPAADPVSEPGMYRAADGTIYKVQAAKTTGNLYAKKLSVHGSGSASFEYAPGAVRKLSAADKLSLAEAQEFGLAFGVCCVCSRTLTNPDSIEAGIGPVCASRF